MSAILLHLSSTIIINNCSSQKRCGFSVHRLFYEPSHFFITLLNSVSKSKAYQMDQNQFVRQEGFVG
jgi:hypothetical protein